MVFKKNQIVVVSDLLDKRFNKSIVTIDYADEEKIIVEINGQKLFFEQSNKWYAKEMLPSPLVGAELHQFRQEDLMNLLNSRTLTEEQIAKVLEIVCK